MNHLFSLDPDNLIIAALVPSHTDSFDVTLESLTASWTYAIPTLFPYPEINNCNFILIRKAILNRTNI